MSADRLRRAQELRNLDTEAWLLENEATVLRNRAAWLSDEVDSLRKRARALDGSARLVRERSGIDTNLILAAEVLEAEAREQKS